MQERITAVRASISDIVNGTLETATGKHVKSPFGVELRRVVLVGFVVNKFYSSDESKKKKFESITLDDGTETIRVKAWSEMDMALLEGVKENILALVVGRVREYGGEIFIEPEIVREITNPNYMSFHLTERYKAILTRSGVTMPSTDEDDLDVEQEILTSMVSQYPTPVKGLAKDIVSYVQLEASDVGVPLKDIVAYFEEKGKDPDKVQTKLWGLVADGYIIEKPIGHFRPSDI